MERTVQLAAFAVLLGTCVAGMAHTAPWAIAIGGSLLALVGLSRGRLLRAATPEGASPYFDVASVMVSLGNAAVASSASYVLGHGVGWIWGV